MSESTESGSVATNRMVGPGPDDPGAEAQKDRKAKATMAGNVSRLLSRNPKWMIVGWGLVVLAFVLVLPAAYLGWYVFPIMLWKWVSEAWWHWIPGFFAFMMSFCLPIWTGMLAGYLGHFVSEIALGMEERAVEEAQKSVEQTEAEAINKLEETDAAGLLPLLKYSRAQLNAYYTLGINQTKKSYYNALLAMWLGFILLLIGIALYIVPVEQLGLKTPSADFKIITLTGAAIIEFVSALFMWVYKSTTGQFTYFYNRQIFNHTSILAFRMASTMEAKQSDETKRVIIERLLDPNILPERPGLFGSRGMREVLTPKRPAQADKT